MYPVFRDPRACVHHGGRQYRPPFPACLEPGATHPVLTPKTALNHPLACPSVPVSHWRYYNSYNPIKTDYSMEALKIAVTCVIAAVLYEIVDDQFTARIRRRCGSVRPLIDFVLTTL